MAAGDKTRQELCDELDQVQRTLDQQVEERTRLRRDNERLRHQVTEQQSMEAALRESQRTLSTLISNLPGMVYRCRNDNDWTMEFVSEGCFELTECRPEELIGGHCIFRELIHPQDQAPIWQQVQEALQTPKAFQLTYRITTKTGKEKWVWEQGRGIFSAAGKVLALEGFITDISAKKEAEKALQTNEERLRFALDSVLDGIITIDDRGQIQSFNPAAEKIFGFSAAEVAGKNVQLLMPEPDRSRHDQYIRNYLHTGRKKIIGIGREAIGKRKDGTTFPLELAISEFSLGDKRMFTGMIRDITGRKQAEEALRQSEARMRLMVENLPAGAVHVTDGALVLNRAAELITGYSRDEITAVDTWFATLYKNHWSEVRQLYETDRAAGFPHPRVVPLTHKDGSERVVEFAAYRDDQSEVWLMTDITERTKAEEGRKTLEEQLRQAQKMEAVGQLAGGVAHDFNNQLGIILFDVDFLLEELTEDTSMRQDLAKIRKVVLRAANLTRQLLLFSRREPMDKQPIGLNHQITELQKMLGRLLGEDIIVTLDLSEELLQVKADPVNMDQVLTNLAVNARDAMPQGGTLRIETQNVVIDESYCRYHSQARPGHFVRLTVGDTGTGMDEDVKRRLFEPFYTTKEVGKGTGLGLAVVYGVVQSHQGWITVDSRPGEGSQFQVYLPALVEGLDAGHLDQESAQAEVKKRKKGCILLVEDEPDLRERMARALDMQGYVVYACGTVAEARAVFFGDATSLDLVLSDVVLPDGRGPDMIVEFLQIKPDLPALLTSGYTDERVDLDQVKRIGLPLLSKPVAVAELLNTIDQILHT